MFQVTVKLWTFLFKLLKGPVFRSRPPANGGRRTFGGRGVRGEQRDRNAQRIERYLRQARVEGIYSILLDFSRSLTQNWDTLDASQRYQLYEEVSQVCSEFASVPQFKEILAENRDYAIVSLVRCFFLRLQPDQRFLFVIVFVEPFSNLETSTFPRSFRENRSDQACHSSTREYSFLHVLWTPLTHEDISLFSTQSGWIANMPSTRPPGFELEQSLPSLTPRKRSIYRITSSL